MFPECLTTISRQTMTDDARMATMFQSGRTYITKIAAGKTDAATTAEPAVGSPAVERDDLIGRIRVDAVGDLEAVGNHIAGCAEAEFAAMINSGSAG